jgi:hypothetical protein
MEIKLDDDLGLDNYEVNLHRILVNEWMDTSIGSVEEGACFCGLNPNRH